MFHLKEKQKHIHHYTACDYRKENKRNFMQQKGVG